MASKLFDLLQKYQRSTTEYEAATNKSRVWYRQAAKEISDIDPKVFLKKRGPMGTKMNLIPQNGIRVANIGRPILYNYDPKGKQKLPYYDTFPCMVPLDVGRKYLLGLNLHYIPPYLRARMLDGLYSIYKDRHLNENKRLQLTYEMVKSSSRLRWYKPCIKKYLVSHIRSNVYVIEPEAWDLVVMLPLERFQKKSKHQVWKDSKKIIGY